MKYNIFNQTTGEDLGTWEGATAGDAITAMARAGGFTDFPEACALDAKYRGELVTTAVGLPSEQVAHTPTPWAVTEGETSLYPRAIRSADGRYLIAEFHAWDSQKDANAAFIVRACNAHEGLVAALRELSQCDGSDANVSSAEVLAARVRSAALKALALAGAA